MAGLSAVAGFPPEFVASVIRGNFASKGKQVVEVMDAVAGAYGYARDLRYGEFPDQSAVRREMEAARRPRTGTRCCPEQR